MPDTEGPAPAPEQEMQQEVPGIVGVGGELTDFYAEQQLIGTLITDPEAFAAIEDHVFEEDFWDRNHRHIFAACASAHREGYAISMKEIVGALGGAGDRVLFADGTTVAKYVAKLIADRDPGLRLDDLARCINELADRRAAELEDMATTPPDPESRFGAIRFRDLDAPAREHDYLIKGVLTRFERSLLVGPSGSGKSFVAADLAMDVAMGTAFLGRRVRQGLVLYQAGEGSLGLKKRLRAVRKERGIPAEKNIPFVLMTSPVDLYANDADTVAFIKEARAWAEVYKVETKLDLELIVIDTLSAATPGANENASEDVSKILARLALIAKHCNCHVMLVHHMNAAGSRPRGHTSLFANIENAIEVNMTDRTCVGFADDGHEIVRKVRVARVTKQKDDADALEWEFALKQVVLGKDMDGDPITSCVVVGVKDDGEVTVAGAGAASKKEGGPGGFKLSKQEGLFFECVLEATAEHGIAPPPPLGLPSSITRVVDYEHVKAFMARKMLREDDNTEDGKKRHRERVKSALKRAREALTSFKIVGVDSPYIWHTGKHVRGFAQTQPARQDLFNDRGPADDADLGEFA